MDSDCVNGFLPPQNGLRSAEHRMGGEPKKTTLWCLDGMAIRGADLVRGLVSQRSERIGDPGSCVPLASGFWLNAGPCQIGQGAMFTFACYNGSHERLPCDTFR